MYNDYMPIKCFTERALWSVIVIVGYEAKSIWSTPLSTLVLKNYNWDESFKSAPEDQIVRNTSSLEHADVMCVGKSYAYCQSPFAWKRHETQSSWTWHDGTSSGLSVGRRVKVYLIYNPSLEQ